MEIEILGWIFWEEKKDLIENILEEGRVKGLELRRINKQFCFKNEIQMCSRYTWRVKFKGQKICSLKVQTTNEMLVILHVTK